MIKPINKEIFSIVVKKKLCMIRHIVSTTVYERYYIEICKKIYIYSMFYIIYFKMFFIPNCVQLHIILIITRIHANNIYFSWPDE